MASDEPAGLTSDAEANSRERLGASAMSDSQGRRDAPAAVVPGTKERQPGARFGLFLCDFCETAAIENALAKIPEEIAARFEEIVVMLDAPEKSRSIEAEISDEVRLPNLRFHQPPRVTGYGATRKGAFEYARLRCFDSIIVLPAGTREGAQRLPLLLEHAQAEPEELIIAVDGRAIEESLLSRVAKRFSTFAQNRILGLQLEGYRSGLRLYPVEALVRIPYPLNTNDIRFDSELLLQMRALGVTIHEIPAMDFEGNEHEPARAPASGLELGPGVRRDLLDCVTALMYRLHQAHVTRDGRYLVDHDVHYTLKQSETGSHMQVVSAIAENSQVLDLGCSTGLLARLLQAKNVEVTGVDAEPRRHLAKELGEYYQRDLELPLELPYERIFDYVVCADVIEHLKNRQQLLRGARRYLKPDGRLIISTPNIAIWFYRLSLLVGRFEYGPRGVLDETHVHLYTGSSFRREVENAGFDVVRTRVTALPFEVVFESTGRSRFVRSLASAYHLLARIWPSMFAYQYVLEARITTLDDEATRESSPRP